jgi:long-chain acyl-CoA synthetase
MSIAPFRALEDQAFGRPHHIAFIFGNEVWTYRRMLDETIRLARALVARGISQGDRIALHMSSGPELAVAYHARSRMGAIAVPINNRFKSAELKPML